MSTISLPVLHILFYLATLFLPAGTTSFSVSYAQHAAHWTLQDDGWRGTVDTEQDIGLWTVDRLVVSVTDQGMTTPTDLSSFVQRNADKAGGARILIDQKPLGVSSTSSTLTVSQAEDGVFATPAVITYSSK